MDAAVTEVEVTREGHSLIVSWQVQGGQSAVNVSVAPARDAFETSKVVTVDDGETSVRFDDVGPGRRYVSVSLVGGGGPAVIAAERRLPFEGPTNFRDIGGYPTNDGRRTRWGLVYRSDGLDCMTPPDLEVFRSLGIQNVFDLRNDSERVTRPDPIASVWIPVQGKLVDSMPTFLDKPGAGSAEGEGLLRDVYRILLAGAGPLFGQLLGALAEPGGMPAVIHCTGGKDRTGLAVALLLELLGVPREVVLDDYELTAQYRLREHQAETYDTLIANGLPPEAAAAVLGAPRWAMAEALDSLDFVHGGIRAYLGGPAGMAPSTLLRLRSELLD